MCECASTPPTYPTYRSEYHLPDCPDRAQCHAAVEGVRCEREATVTFTGPSGTARLCMPCLTAWLRPTPKRT